MPTRVSASKIDTSLTATEKRKQEAEQVLASFTSIFLGDVYKFRIDTKIEAIRLIKERADKISEVRPAREIGEGTGVYLARSSGWKSLHPAQSVVDAIVEGKHTVFQSQLMAWLDSLEEFSRKQLRELAHLAARYRPAYCEVGQEAHWARMKIESFLIRDLAQEVSRFEHGRGQSSNPAIRRDDLSSVETWSRWACEDWPDFDVSESGFAEPWAAPAWYDRWFNTRLWIKHARPERLTPEQTDRVSRSYQRLFADRLQNELSDAEHRVRVELASVAPGSRDQGSEPDGVADQAAAEQRHLKFIVDDFSGAVTDLAKDIDKFNRETPFDYLSKLTGPDRNARVRPVMDRWLEKCVASLNKHFPHLVATVSRRTGTPSSAAVIKSYRLVRTALYKTRPAEALVDAWTKFIPLDFLPPGVGIDSENLNEFCFRHEAQIFNRLERLREEELAKIDLLPPSNEPQQKASPLSMQGKLPAKKRDLSQYLDAAGLTDRQRECLSLAFEYELPKSAIARRLGITRKTVDEHIAAGNKRLDRDRLREKLAKNMATKPTY